MKSISLKGWTFGAEHELSDWDTSKGWDGFGRDPEPNIVNSNGIAADPRLLSYQFGGEINTPPTTTIAGQAESFERFLRRHPDAAANYRTGLHVHIKVPGLRNSLEHLKRLQQFIYHNRAVYLLVDPIDIPSTKGGARKRAQWMHMSHHTTIPEYRVANQMKATSLTEFFEREVPRSKAGKPLWHAQPRAAINLRQLLQTETIEFRHFVATTNPEEVLTAVEWCRDYLMVAFTGGSAEKLYYNEYERRRRKFPLLSEYPYEHWAELRWQQTTISKNKREVIDQNIAVILETQKKRPRLIGQGLSYSSRI